MERKKLRDMPKVELPRVEPEVELMEHERHEASQETVSLAQGVVATAEEGMPHGEGVRHDKRTSRGYYADQEERIGPANYRVEIVESGPAISKPPVEKPKPTGLVGDLLGRQERIGQTAKEDDERALSEYSRILRRSLSGGVLTSDIDTLASCLKHLQWDEQSVERDLGILRMVDDFEQQLSSMSREYNAEPLNEQIRELESKLTGLRDELLRMSNESLTGAMLRNEVREARKRHAYLFTCESESQR